MQFALFDTEPDVQSKLPGYPCVISPCGLYRYTCYRIWANHLNPRLVMFLMLNPSRADADVLDNTLKRCMAFAKNWGFDGMCICNLFAFRSTDPDEMLSAADPVGDDADYWLCACIDHCELVVAAWSTMGGHLRRDEQVRVLLSSIKKPLHVLKLNKDGSPMHPIYAKGELQPIPWPRERCSPLARRRIHSSSVQPVLVAADFADSQVGDRPRSQDRRGQGHSLQSLQ